MTTVADNNNMLDWAVDCNGDVVPMEITFMDNGGNIFVLCEFIDYVNSHII
jgi:hypothetical protein